MQQLDLFAEPRGKRRTTPIFKGKPLHPDLRREHFKEVVPTMPEKRAKVLDALKHFGPCTCRELALKMCWEVTSIRPRMTELFKTGIVRQTGSRRDGEYEFEVIR